VTVRSFADYRHHIRRITRELKPTAALQFCNWCIERFQRQFGDTVWDGLTSDERLAFAGLISELRATEALNELLSADRARSLKKELEAFGPSDEIEAIEVEPDAIGFRELVWSTLEFCRTQDICQVCAVAEEMINAIDHHRPDVEHGLGDMFCSPSLASELALQTDYIRSLT
jgi:hypothetical protein